MGKISSNQMCKTGLGWRYHPIQNDEVISSNKNGDKKVISFSQQCGWGEKDIVQSKGWNRYNLMKNRSQNVSSSQILEQKESN